MQAKARAIKDIFNGRLSRPVFTIKLQDSTGKGSLQKTSKETFEKLIANKTVVLVHLHFVLDEGIDLICNNKFANSSMTKCKKSLTLFNATRFMLPEENAAKLFLVMIPEPYFICDTISRQNSVLELI